MIIPEEYVVQKFYQHAGYPKYTKSTNTYTGGCPVCREGRSWGRKSRLYYIPKDYVVCCHNCGWYSNPVDWVIEVEKITYKDILKQIESYEYEYGIPEVKDVKPTITYELPKDCINLFDRTQLSYYKDNSVVRKAAETIIKRRLNTAINKPKSIYTTITDYTHKNRLVIPFNDKDKKCIFYQSRSLYDEPDKPKYLSKQNSEKSLFNYDQVSSSSEHVFITEGPIDSFFIENSVAVAGIQEHSYSTFTETQKNQLDRLFLTQQVWVLDSQWQDTASLNKTKTLLKQNCCVFIWPRDVGRRFKDINDMCVYFKVDHISKEFLIKNTYCGLQGLVKLKQIR